MAIFSSRIFHFFVLEDLFGERLVLNWDDFTSNLYADGFEPVDWFNASSIEMARKVAVFRREEGLSGGEF